jgi:phosphotriesterase-related protein
MRTPGTPAAGKPGNGAHEIVQTVLGPVDPQELGRTLVHEHLYMDAPSLTPAIGEARGHGLTPISFAKARWDPGLFPENVRFTRVDLVVEELELFKRVGGHTIVELTPVGLGRNPEALRQIAERARINIVMGGGFFLEQFHPPDLGARSTEEIAESLIAEVRAGVGATGIKPGILGEIGTGDPVTAEELRVLRAHAVASVETGVALSLHIHPWGFEGARVLAVLESEGVAAGRVAMGHMNTAVGDDRYQRSMLDRGVFLEYDLFGFDHSLLGPGRYPPSEWDVAAKIAELVHAGYGDQILLSQDIGELIRLQVYGGYGYGHVFEHILPLLVRHGLTPLETEALVIQNPARLLAMPDGHRMTTPASSQRSGQA